MVRPTTLILMLGLGQLVANAAIAKDVERRQGVDFTAGAEAGIRYESNLYHTENNETDSTAVILSPKLDLTYSWGKNELFATYLGELAKLDTNSEDDYFDNYFGLGYDFWATSRHRFKGLAGLYKEHVPFGVDRTENTPREDRELDEFDESIFRGEYFYGAENAIFNLGLYGEYREREFTSNRNETFFLDNDSETIGLQGVYNYSRRTFLLLDIERRDISFDDATPGFSKRDATEERILAGVRWLATSRTVGAIRVGHISREHDSADREDYSGIDWDISLSWSPTARATITAETQRATRESFDETADFINTRSFGLSWEHQWTARVDTELSYAVYDADYDGQPRADLGGDTRQDDTNSVEINGTYLLNRNLDIALGIEHRERESNVPTLDYSSNIAKIVLRARY